MDQLSELFLKSGALLSLDADRVALGVGGLEASESPAKGRLSFYTPDFFLEDPKPWKVPRQTRILSRAELVSSLRGIGRAQISFQGMWRAPSREDFQDSFEALQDALFDGVLKKGVPVVFESAIGEVGPELLAGMLLELLTNGNGRIYGFWEAGEGILGLTPEDLFLGKPDGTIRTMALAGTYPAGSKPEALLSDPKERAEHQWVIDDIRESLSGLGDVRVGETRVLELPTLMHLKTEIEVKPRRPVSFMEWVRALHPTAALGAFPRQAGASWLKREDSGVRRRRFGAPFGVLLGDGSGVCVVAIRNVQWEKRGLRIGSGCGVVPESNADREWKELALKRESVKRNFGW